jgi:hypothetical protein
MATNKGNWFSNQDEVSDRITKQVTAYGTADGAIDPAVSLATVTTPVDAVSLAVNTVVGHIITIKSLSGTSDNLVLTPAAFNDGTTVTFDADDEWCQLQSSGAGWFVIATNATVA